MNAKNVSQIVSDYLRENGFDGLYNAGECACKIDDLGPCDCSIMNCEPGYLQPCPPECGEHNWHIGAQCDASRWAGKYGTSALDDER